MYLPVLSSRWVAASRCSAACLLGLLSLLASESDDSLALLRPVPLAELQELAADAIAAGFPDAATGELFAGVLRITSIENPEAPSELSYQGLHIALPDGTFLRNLHIPVRADETLQIDRSELQPIEATTLAELLEHLDPKLRDWAAKSLDARTAKSQLDSGQAHALRPYAPLLALTATSVEPPADASFISFAACLHLARRGLPDAGRLLVPHALAIGYATREEFTWPPQAPMMLYEGQRSLAVGNFMEQVAIELLLPQQLRKAPLPLARHWAIKLLLGRLAHPTAEDRRPVWVTNNYWNTMPRESARQLVLAWAAVDGQQTEAEELLAAYDTAQRLQSEAANRAEGLDLPARVASWRPPQFPYSLKEWSELADTEGRYLTPGLVAMMRGRSPKLAEPPAENYGFRMPDLDGLLPLLDSEAPSAWIEGTVPRSLGDQALRLIASSLSFDPRLLSEVPLDTPWTPALRQRSAEAIRTWWAAQADRERQQLQLAAVPVLSTTALSEIVSENTDPERLARFRSAIAAAWQAEPPHFTSAYYSAKLLGQLGGDAAISQAVVRGSFADELRGLEACWHAAHDNLAPAEALLAVWSANPIPDAQLLQPSGFLRPNRSLLLSRCPVQELILALSQKPQIEHFLRIRRLLDGDLQEALPALWLLNALEFGAPYTQGLIYLQQHPRSDIIYTSRAWSETTIALPLMLCLHLLGDQRLLPPALRELLPSVRRDLTEPVAEDLRVCDLALASSRALQQFLHDFHDHPELKEPVAAVHELLRTIQNHRQNLLAPEAANTRQQHLTALQSRLQALLAPILHGLQLPNPFAAEALMSDPDSLF